MGIGMSNWKNYRNIQETSFILFFRSCPISLHAVKKFKVVIYRNTVVLNFIPKNVVETIDFLAQFLYIYILEAVPTETAMKSSNINLLRRKSNV